MAQEQDGPDESDMENLPGVPERAAWGSLHAVSRLGHISPRGEDTKYMEDKEGATEYQVSWVCTHHTVVLSNLSLQPWEQEIYYGLDGTRELA